MDIQVIAFVFSCRNFSLRPPFCDDFSQLPFVTTAGSVGKAMVFREIGGNSSCHYDRGSIGICNGYNKTTPFDPNFQVCGRIPNSMFGPTQFNWISHILSKALGLCVQCK